MSKLTSKEIEKLASRPGVKRDAVENFLYTLEDMSYQDALYNCEIDAKVYQWNHKTSGTIREGLILYYFR